MDEASNDITNTGNYMEGNNSRVVGGNKNTQSASNVTTGDITDSKGIIIGNEIKTGDITIVDTQVFINEISNECGLILIHPNHFKDNSNTSDDFERWRKGFPLSVESIYQKKEYVRERVLDEMREKLEERKRLLILGESGTSKTTLLMEIICCYFDQGYKILYNFGDDELKNTNAITEKIKGLAYADNKILIVIDNVHSPKMSIIFNVINNIQPLNLDKKDRIRFLLAARQPEFDWVLERNLFDDSLVSQRIEELFDDNYRYTIPYFTKDETKDFISKYSLTYQLSSRA